MNIINQYNNPFNSEFQAFVEKFPDWKERFNIQDRDGDPIYKRILLVYESTDIKHQVYVSINTETGAIYLDDRRRGIFARIALTILSRPFYMIGQTLWHVTLIGPFCQEMIYSAQGKQTPEEGLRNFKFSCINALLTPVIQTAIIIVSIAAVILSPFSPNSLYRSRDAVGTLERLLHHDPKSPNLSHFPLHTLCLSPIGNIATVHKRYYKEKELTEENIQESFVKIAKHLATSFATNCNLIDNCLITTSVVPPYTSKAL